MGRYLRGLPSHPDLVLASTARRVSETLDLILLEIPEEITVMRDRSLYLATLERLLSRLRATSGNINNILIIGHNPGIQELALLLSGEVVDELTYDARERMKDKFATGALAIIRFPEVKHWREAGIGKGRLVSFTRPRDLAK